MLSAPSQYAPGMPLHGTFWPAFLAAVTANVGAWASLSLNISDFSRYARSQREQGEGVQGGGGGGGGGGVAGSAPAPR